MKDIAIIIPTYNVAASIIATLTAIRTYVPKATVIIVDDNSPDKTAQKIKQIYNSNKNIHIISRQKKAGRGSAVIRGFQEALKNKKIQYIIEMDADLSHNPQQILLLVAKCKKKDIIIASKYIKFSKIIGLSVKRRIFSAAANFLLRTTLRIPIHDYTNGYRCYKRQVVETIDFRKVQAKGFIVLSEIAYIAYKKGFTFGEIPTVCVYNPTFGSNFNRNEIKEALLTIIRLKLTRGNSI